MRRRTFIGTLAAATAGNAAAVGAADRSADGPSGRQNAGTGVEDYANRAGKVTRDGLQRAFDDSQNGVIGSDLLREVIDAWNTGERVLDREVVELSSSIDSDRTLEKNPDDPGGEAVVYQATSTVSVSAELTIEPGVIVEFQQGTGLDIGSDATLLAEGAADETILLTATTAQRGWWDGVYVNTTDVENVLGHAIVEYAGNGRNGNLELGTGFGSQAELAVHDCTFRHGGGYGLYAGAETTLTETDGNTYTGNADGAVRVQAPTMHQLSGSSTFTGNDSDYVLVADNDVSGSGRDDEQRTWPALDVPWRMDGSHSVDDVELRIDPGATFEFTESSSLRFDTGSRVVIDASVELSSLETDGEQSEEQERPVAEARAENEITFTGTDDQRGWWNGVHLVTTDIDNVMRNVLIEYGGGGDREADLEIGTGFGNAGTVDIRNCTFRHADGYGLWAGDGATIVEDAFNTYTGNSAGAARIQGPQLHQLSESSTFTGNDTDYVLVSGRNVTADRAGTDDVVWDSIDVPWRVDGNLHVTDVKAFIVPGATFEFTESSRLTFDSGSAMDIRGDEDEQIRLTGTDAQRGWWDGVYVYSEGTDNVIDQTVIEYAGNGLDGNLQIGTEFGQAGTLSITDCTFRDSGGYGLYVGSGVDLPETENNTYTGNADGAARVKTTQMHMLSDSSSFTGNDSDRVYVSSRNLNENRVDADPATWPAIDVPFRMDDGNHKVTDVELAVDPGVECRFEEQGRLTFGSDSTITIEGSEDEPITLTGTEEIAGWWDGIYINSESLLNTIDYAVVTYGGRGLGGNIDMATGFGHDATLTVTNSEIAHSRAAGLIADSNNPPENASSVLQDNDFHDNEGGDYVVDN